MSEKTRQNVKNVNGRGSTEYAHTNIIVRLGGVMDKYNKYRFFTALVLEIGASLYLTPSDAIFVMQLSLEPPPPPPHPGRCGDTFKGHFFCQTPTK